MELAVDISINHEKLFTQVYRQLHVKVYRYFLKKARSADEAAELTQQAFIKLWKSKALIEKDIEPDALLFTIANSVLIDYWRKRPMLSTVPLDYVDDAKKYLKPVHDAMEAREIVEKMAQQLPPVRRKIFELKTIYGFANAEIARQLNINIKTVEDHYTKALRLLKAQSISNESLLSIGFYLAMLS